jgi:hypothetical protein
MGKERNPIIESKLDKNFSLATSDILYQDGCLPGSCAVQSGRSLPMFQMCLLPP